MSEERIQELLPSTEELKESHSSGVQNQSPGKENIEGEAFDSFSSMNDLKERAPEVHRLMMQGIALNICREMQNHQRRLKKILKQGRENS